MTRERERINNEKRLKRQRLQKNEQDRETNKARKKRTGNRRLRLQEKLKDTRKKKKKKQTKTIIRQ